MRAEKVLNDNLHQNMARVTSCNVPGKHVSTKDTANDVPQMRYIIHIGQGTRDKDILFSFNGQTVKENQSLYFGEGWKNAENAKWSLLNIAF